MAYLRRIVTVSPEGRKQVAYRSMGDADRKGRAMSYVRTPKHRVNRFLMRHPKQFQSLGGAADCGAGQQWYPNLTYAGTTGQCATPAQAQAMLASGQATGNLNPKADGGDDPWAIAGKVGGGILSAFLTPKPQAPQYPQQAPGMSTTTKLALAGAAVLGVALIVRSRS